MIAGLQLEVTIAVTRTSAQPEAQGRWTRTRMVTARVTVPAGHASPPGLGPTTVIIAQQQLKHTGKT